MKKNLLWLLVVLFMALGTTASDAQNAQSRQYVKNAIDGWNECRNVAITKYNGNVALYGTNGYAMSGCPKRLTETIEKFHREDVYIDDVHLTEGGRWLVLYGMNGLTWYGIPYSLESKLREFSNNNEIITSVTFDDNGNWIAITQDYVASSSADIQNFVMAGSEEYGQVWSACITNDAMIVVYEGGYKYVGNVPDSLLSALNETTLDYYRIKIAGTSWFFADRDGYYQYFM